MYVLVQNTDTHEIFVNYNMCKLNAVFLLNCSVYD